MEITIQSLHFAPSYTLNNYITEKANMLLHFSDRIESAKVTLQINKSDNADEKICEIQLLVPGDTLFAKRQCSTFEKQSTKPLKHCSIKSIN